MSTSYYSRKDRTPSVTRITHKIDNFNGVDAYNDESGLGLYTATYAHNVEFCGGTLMQAKGVSSPTYVKENGTVCAIPNAGVEGARYISSTLYRKYDYENDVEDYRIVSLLSDGSFYECPLEGGTFSKIIGLHQVTEKVTLLNYYMDGKDILIMATTKGIFKYDGTTLTAYLDAPLMGVACLHYDRVFGVDEENSNTIRFSNALDPFDWDTTTGGSGYISLMDEGGQIEKLISFQGSIYVFREYAIHRLTAFANPYEYSITKIYETNCNIQAKTICIAGDTMIFMADNRLYTFDGYTVTEVLPKLTALISDSNNAVGGYYKNKYYLSCCIGTKGDVDVIDEGAETLTNNAMLAIDLTTGDYSITRGIDVQDYAHIAGNGINIIMLSFANSACCETLGMLDNSGKFFGRNMPIVWEGPTSNLGYIDKYKVARRMYITTLHGVDVTITMDDTEKTFHVNGSTKPQCVPISMQGYTIKIKLSTTTEKMYITNIQLECDAIRRYYAN